MSTDPQPKRSLTSYGTDAEALGTASKVQGFAIIPRLFPYLRNYGVRFVLMCVVTVVSSTMKIGGIVFIKPFCDIILGTFDVEDYAAIPFLGEGTGREFLVRFADLLSGKPDIALLMLMGFLLGTLGLHAITNIIATYLQNYIGGRMGMDVQRALVDHVLAQPISFFEERGKGELMGVLQRDSLALYRTLHLMFDRFIRSGVEATAAVALALALDWRLTLLAGGVLIPTGVIIRGFMREMRKRERATFHFMGVGGVVLQEILGAPQAVKAFRMEQYLAERLDWARRKRFRLNMSLIKTRLWMGFIVEALIALMLAGFVYYNGRQLMSGRLVVSDFILLYACLGALITPIRKMARGMGDFVANTQSVVRVFDLMDRVPAVADDPNAPALPPVEGKIEFDNVSFSYPGGWEALHDVSFTIMPGERVALVGMSGAGKSTLASLLLRFYDPTEGEIRIDGHNLARVSQTSLRDQVGLVPQDTVIFSDTVRMNITCGRRGKDEAVEAAARAARAHEFIEPLPDGYETSLRDLGTNLSGGQRQRLVVARCLFRNTPILILDEATSSLDAVAEAELQEELDLMAEGRTTIIIAHRFSTILSADRLILLHKGQIVAIGNHQELYESNPLYRELFERQLLVPGEDGQGDVGATADRAAAPGGS